MNYTSALLLFFYLILAPAHGVESDALLLSDENVSPESINGVGPTPFIVGGSDVSESEGSNFALVIITPQGASGSAVCGGTLIASNKVLTAARCVTTLGLDSDIKVIPRYRDRSETGFPERRVRVVSYKTHPGFGELNPFGELNLENDLAILTLETEVMGSYASLFSGPDELVDASAIGIGAGVIDPDILELAPILQKFEAKIESNPICQDEMGFVITFEDGSTAYEVLPSMLCLKLFSTPVGPCIADEGGPLLANIRGRSVVVGIMSYITDSSCADIDTIAIYTRLSSFTEFIKKESPQTRFISSDFVAPPPLIGTIKLLLLQD